MLQVVQKYLPSCQQEDEMYHQNHIHSYHQDHNLSQGLHHPIGLWLMNNKIANKYKHFLTNEQIFVLFVSALNRIPW